METPCAVCRGPGSTVASCPCAGHRGDESQPTAAVELISKQFQASEQQRQLHAAQQHAAQIQADTLPADTPKNGPQRGSSPDSAPHERTATTIHDDTQRATHAPLLRDPAKNPLFGQASSHRETVLTMQGGGAACGPLPATGVDRHARQVRANVRVISAIELATADEYYRPNARGTVAESVVDFVNRHLGCYHSRQVDPANPAVYRGRVEVANIRLSWSKSAGLWRSVPLSGGARLTRPVHPAETLECAWERGNSADIDAEENGPDTPDVPRTPTVKFDLQVMDEPTIEDIVEDIIFREFGMHFPNVQAQGALPEEDAASAGPFAVLATWGEEVFEMTALQRIGDERGEAES
ncbi:unnamed protein product [Prorocentrum cordatum]|uniref:Uncharacterized protein n=1 Tax=Prorocentrum cordatum TaxID=2364126 RepID=A0ABN9S6Q6_9DINO|nr:unnamed protein product [Polarella glacialis]